MNTLMRLSLESVGLFRAMGVYFGDWLVRRSPFWVWFLERYFERSLWFRASRMFF